MGDKEDMSVVYYRDGGTVGLTSPENNHCLFIDYRIKSKTKGQFYRKYPTVDSTPLGVLSESDKELLVNVITNLHRDKTRLLEKMESIMDLTNSELRII